ncbi:MAG: hypothetical protein ACF8Q5_10165 [Phycisphaerales bacterium JB040]
MLTTLTTMCLLAAPPASAAQPGARANPGVVESPNPEWDDAWPALEAPILTNHRQITRREDFLKAGEAYFDPTGTRVIFQAIPVPPEGEEPGEHYTMYVSTLPEEASDRLTLIAPVSAPGSANTCGWFHPTEPGTILLGTTTTPPAEPNAPGYQRGTGRYKWDFPREMDIVRLTGDVAAVMSTTGGTYRFMEQSREALVSRDGYDAEGTWSPDGRFVLYTHCEPGSNDGDLWVLDTTDGSHTPLVTAEGYDGGPFFSPDGTRITYRSDRRGDNLLQVFVADLVFDADTGTITGIERETQLTDNEHVNWCPFFSPDGKYLFYATSELSHANYEVFAVSAKADEPYRPRIRVTKARGFDGLPVFSPDGTKMMWTAQRGPQAEGDARPTSQLWLADYNHAAFVRAYQEARKKLVEEEMMRAFEEAQP